MKAVTMDSGDQMSQMATRTLKRKGLRLRKGEPPMPLEAPPAKRGRLRLRQRGA